MTLPRRVLEGTTYLLTRRCLGQRFLLRPGAELNRLVVYCLALAASKHGMEVHALGVMSNHYHLVVTDVRGVLPDFIMGLHRSSAMSIKRLRDWDEVVWEPNVPYSAVELAGRSEILDNGYQFNVGRFARAQRTYLVTRRCIGRRFLFGTSSTWERSVCGV